MRPALLMLPLLIAATTAIAAPADPQGRFLTASGNLEVDVAPCGEGTALCGTVSKVVANHSMSRPGEAMKPADDRPALGLRILIDFQPEAGEPGTWQGRIYNRENGKTYDCRMTLDEAGNLQLRAYVGLPLFGKTQVWQRQAVAP